MLQKSMVNYVNVVIVDIKMELLKMRLDRDKLDQKNKLIHFAWD